MNRMRQEGGRKKGKSRAEKNKTEKTSQWKKAMYLDAGNKQIKTNSNFRDNLMRTIHTYLNIRISIKKNPSIDAKSMSAAQTINTYQHQQKTGQITLSLSLFLSLSAYKQFPLATV